MNSFQVFQTDPDLSFISKIVKRFRSVPEYLISDRVLDPGLSKMEIYSEHVTNPIQNKPSYLGYVLLSLVYITFAIYLSLNDFKGFDAYYFGLNSLLVTNTIYSFGLVFLLVYMKRFSTVNDVGLASQLSIPLISATIFGIITIGIDYTYHFAEDINVELPNALLFYPLIALIVEVLFHLIPIVMLYLVAGKITSLKFRRQFALFGILGIALVEPLFQVISSDMSTFPVWASILFTIHLFFFNLVQIAILKKYNFISMYAFRFTYYIFWHIIWGVLRLEILF